ncbi:DUF1353 domain-containing protein [Campylobacter volucris]|uniref:DUF1353 domain-containing protein n=1 Tax=Campylobacter volucris TaxID=1031542 RepID=A0AAE5YGM5_9BACT|nr:DUF1353 domain-containing protein [Campylobacter volucris]AJC94142.1 hypothetical protein (DUF1353 domain) [Campylobacter volucris LMG 24379]KAB0580300.1 DUF1353 domain-containing protein [Campylobacter volucris]MBF7044714.1 DUF1353 domain-containing protein [Campylobacter volucris]MBF7047914.1 DUF1353 domain-containing protein [Campylobacter volucris]MBF7067762.1 DUF1353 domain-containing protein [Campylobacter volucris]
MLKRVCVKPFSKDRFILVQDYEFNLKSFKGKIPANFTSNGANIPRIFWSIFPPNSPEYLSAVVVHDYLCEKANTKNDYKLADLALYEAMQELGCSKFKTFVFYHACNGFHMVKCFLKGV